MAWEDRAYNRSDEPPRIRFNFPMPGQMTMAVMGACLVVFLVVNVFRAHALHFAARLDFNDALALKQPWRWLTYAYLHASGSHIFWNMLSLYFFLTPLEAKWGSRKAFGFYTLGTIAAAATFGLMCIFYPFAGLVGASGGALAALGACAYLFPEMMLFMIIPIRVAAALLGVLYLLTIAGDRDASNAAHLGGLVFGFFAPFYGRHLFQGTLERFERARKQRVVRAEHDEQQTVDRILEKVHQSGMNSLTRGERRTLKQATDRQRADEPAMKRRRP